MRQVTARRIHGLMREMGANNGKQYPSAGWKAARKLWFSHPRYRIGETVPNPLRATRPHRSRFMGFRTNRPSYHFMATKNSNHLPFSYQPMRQRQIYGGISPGINVNGKTFTGRRQDRGMGARCTAMRAAEMQRLLLAVKMNLQQVAARAQRKGPKDYGTRTFRMNHGGRGR